MNVKLSIRFRRLFLLPQFGALNRHLTAHHAHYFQQVDFHSLNIFRCCLVHLVRVSCFSFFMVHHCQKCTFVAHGSKLYFVHTVRVLRYGAALYLSLYVFNNNNYNKI